MALQSSAHSPLDPTDVFVTRHIGPTDDDIRAMLHTMGIDSLDMLVAQTVPENIRLQRPLALTGLPADRGLSEQEALQMLGQISKKNNIWRSFLGMGYADCHTPTVILRNVLEDPGWYTQYTPYQAEISQGRLEALLNFQTMVTDLTGMELSNASLLDEATAAAEAMQMAQALDTRKRSVFMVADDCHPQIIAVLHTRASARGITLRIATHASLHAAVAAQDTDVFGVLVQYPATDGRIHSYADLCTHAKKSHVITVVAADLLALTMLQPPGEFGADIVIGSAQRFGVPMGCGGPHAAFLATHDQFKRLIPGRIIGVSKDSRGKPAYRMALQTREQHIRREKATSNICTAQALLAIMAGMYAVYHGPRGLTAIAQRVHRMALVLAEGLRRLGCTVSDAPMFDTVRITMKDAETATRVMDMAHQHHMALRQLDAKNLCIALDETAMAADISALWQVFASATGHATVGVTPDAVAAELEMPQHAQKDPLRAHQRTSPFLSHPVFNQYHCEHDMLRYITRLRNRDLSLAHSMIPLGSCTMKLNATSEMLPVSWPEFARIHPFAPAAQLAGYQEMTDLLAAWLQEITGFSAVSLQPNSGAQGEYAGLMAIRGYHHARGDHHRTICLIPMSAHGTNPASAAMVGMEVVGVACDPQGNVDLADLEIKAKLHADRLAALMVTYPSTHGVFEEGIKRLCTIVHAHGGQVYLDGANMNAQVGVCRPGDIGADVCHINLHKTFCIPHGGGGPGMGPIAVAAHLAPYLPGHPAATAAAVHTGGQGHDRDDRHGGAVSAAQWGSASILPISWMYIAMMGGAGLRRATQVAILNANYIAHRLKDHYPVLFRGSHGRVAHELIIDIRQFKNDSGVQAEDVAKRLMDYGFHAPTMSFPVAGTLMIEPTESESRAELDRLCDALIAIRGEIAKIECGEWPVGNNPLSNAPHTMDMVISSTWDRPYAREVAAFPTPDSQTNKFWPTVGRIDNVWGDRNLMCTCPPMDEI